MANFARGENGCCIFLVYRDLTIDKCPDQEGQREKRDHETECQQQPKSQFHDIPRADALIW